MTVDLLLILATIVLLILAIVLPRIQYALHGAVLCLALALLI